MVQTKYLGADKAIKDALVANRGFGIVSAKEQKILELERKLESAKLTNSEITDIQKQLIKLRTS
jgi:hypothetical protein